MKTTRLVLALLALLAWPSLAPATQLPLTSAYVLAVGCAPPLTNCEVELTDLHLTDVVTVDQDVRFVLANMAVTNPDAVTSTVATSLNVRVARDGVDIASETVLAPPGATATIQVPVTILAQGLGSHSYRVYIATNRGPLTLTTDTYLGVFTLTQVVGGNLTVGASPLASGTNGRVLFDDSGVVGEDGGLTYNKTTDTLTTNVSTATALAANGANCAAGNAPLGVDAAGAVESCFDAATQAELDTHAALTTAHGSTSANTASTIVQRDASGNFSAGTITAALTGNASTATALAANGGNCTAGNYPLGVDASGAAESCTSFDGAVLPAVDTTVMLRGSADNTKQVRFEVDGLTTATTRVLTVPDADMTLVGTTATQTLTNKSIVASQLTGTVAVANGGTGLTAGTSGGIPAYTAAGTITSSAALTNNAVVLGSGAGAVPVSGVTKESASALHTPLHVTARGGAAPTAGTCGTAPAIDALSQDTAGGITVGTTAPATCTVNFGVTYTDAPHCVCSQTTGARSCGATASTTVLTMTESTPTDGDVLTWVCIGH